MKNLNHTTRLDFICYLVMVLAIIILIIGICTGDETMICISGIVIFTIILYFLILNTYRFIKYGKK